MNASGHEGTKKSLRGLSSCLRVFASSCLALTLLATHASADWPQFRGNHQLTGVATSAPPATLKVLWSLDLQDSMDSSPAIVDGVAYVGTMNGDLVAVDMAAGKVRWKYSTGASIAESSPAVANATVFIGDSSGVLHAVNTADGLARWSFKTDLDIRSSPVVAGDLVLAGSTDGHLYAVEIASGRQRWRTPTDGPVQATPAIHDGIAYIAGCDESFRGIRISDGADVMRIPAGANTGASPVIDGSRAYVGTYNSEVLAFDLEEQTVLWRYENPDRQFPYYSSAALVDGRVIVGGRDRLVHAIDARTGEPAWTFTTRARVDSSPAAAAGRIYIGSSDGRFYVVDAASGKQLWEFEAGGAITASPAISDGKVVVGTTDGVLYCFG
ncbi:MAG: PQQ-binding-like beta-propeller repeat protein [Vicinamibacterales bacterium]